MSDSPLLAGVEFGGSKVLALLGTGPDHIAARRRIPTTSPDETIAAVSGFFSSEAERGNIATYGGIGTFGPVELRSEHPAYGHITVTPKAGWRDTDILTPIREAVGAPVALDTDVNCAALGEGAWGAARDLDSFVYLTIGTGIGGAAIVDGNPLHGLVHPEMGHVAVPHHPDDRYEGRCPFHGDCLEGMASGPAVAERWSSRPEDLTGSDLSDAVDIEAWYLAAGLRSVVYLLAPQRIVIGGGVANLPGLLAAIRASLVRMLVGYPGLPEHDSPDFVVSADLGDMAGPMGTLALARRALPQD
jgi:fructokinase